MPYGVLDSATALASLARLSGTRVGLVAEIDANHQAQDLFGAERDTTSIHGQEIKLRREIVENTLQEPELLTNIIEVSAKNEVGLAQKIARVRALLPMETITVFVETRNAVSVKAIFKRKFGKTLQIRKFKAEFEFNHQWITTSTSFAWFSRNWFLRIWFEIKRRMGRGMRKKNSLLVQVMKNGVME